MAISCTTLRPLSLSPFSVSTYDTSAPPPSSLCIYPILFKHVRRVIADLLISLVPVKRLFIILQFGRVQIFSLGHSLEQTACYCWRAPATVLLGPTEALLPLLGWVRAPSSHRRCMRRSKGQFPTARGPDTQTNCLTHSPIVSSVVRRKAHTADYYI